MITKSEQNQQKSQVANEAESSEALLNAKIEIKNQHRILTENLKYAAKIQRMLIPPESVFEEAFSDYSIFWKPRDILGGDIYWIKRFNGGTVLCVCDCVGHGTAGALLTMVVVSLLDAMVTPQNYRDTAQILYELDKKFFEVFRFDNEDGKKNIEEGCTLAVLFIANNGTVKVSSGGIHVFVCNGRDAIRVSGQRIYVGEGKVKHKDDVNTVVIPSEPDNKFYIATDGLYEQIGDKSRLPFGYARMKELILQHHNKRHSEISEEIKNAFKEHKGNQPQRDDLQLITFNM
ncbi:MAG: SpoIIE family protein phosphatase [Oscillospiraceae bacterium]|nr:SpoIIE family protein phosphatase [Oscillospiraceae bacterium]